MSNVREQPDWWLGADGRWYPPTGIAPGELRCTNGHRGRDGAKFCGTCGASLAAMPPTASQPTPQAPGPQMAPMAPPPTVAEMPRGAATTNPAVHATVTRSPLAYVIALGGVVVGVAPALAWLRDPLGGTTYRLFGLLSYPGPNTVSPTGPAVALGALYLVALVALILPLSPLRPAVAGSLVALVGAAGAGAALWGVVGFLRLVQASWPDLALGPWVGVVGLVLVVIGGLVYSATGRPPPEGSVPR